MPREAGTIRNWFDQGGQAYSRFRPEYPPELARFLASVSPGRTLAVDVGCGNGQLTAQLAAHFDLALGADASVDQIAHAVAHRRVQYVCARAEKLPLATQLAAVPLSIRGFGHVKLGNLALARVREAELLHRLDPQRHLAPPRGGPPPAGQLRGIQVVARA